MMQGCTKKRGHVLYAGFGRRDISEGKQRGAKKRAPSKLRA
jgi:hypothetical protein